MKNFLAILVVIVILIWIVHDPVGAAHTVRGWAIDAGTFVSHAAVKKK